MTPEQQKALTWAIEVARMKATVAQQAAFKSSTRYGSDFQRAQADTMVGHGNALQSLLDGAGDA